MSGATLAALVAALFSRAPAPAPDREQVEPVGLEFRELFDPSPRELVPSLKLRSLEGRRVRLVGFMVHMEAPPAGGFYLAPRPVACDEAGAGTGDLPAEAVWVVVRSSPGAPIPAFDGPLAVTGVLELGNRATPDGRVTGIRVVLDRPEDLPRAASHPKRKSQHPTMPKPEVSP